MIIGRNPADSRSVSSLDDVVSDLGATVVGRQTPVDNKLGSHDSAEVDGALWLVWSVEALEIDVFSHFAALVSANNLVLGGIFFRAVLDAE